MITRQDFCGFPYCTPTQAGDVGELQRVARKTLADQQGFHLMNAKVEGDVNLRAIGLVNVGLIAPHHETLANNRYSMTGTIMRAHTFSEMAAARFAGNAASLLSRPDLKLFAVAQSVGDGAQGRWAADTIISQIGKLCAPESLPSHARILAQLGEAHDRIHSANQSRSVAAQGVVAALGFDQAHAFGLWVGNCRIYRLREAWLTLLTEDHDVATALRERANAAKPDDNDPMKHVLTRAIGGKTAVAADRFLDRYQCGDRYLITGSGLARALPDTDISRQLGRGTPREASDRLYGLAMSRGAVPNFGIIVIDAPQPEEDRYG